MKISGRDDGNLVVSTELRSPREWVRNAASQFTVLIVGLAAWLFMAFGRIIFVS